MISSCNFFRLSGYSLRRGAAAPRRSLTALAVVLITGMFVPGAAAQRHVRLNNAAYLPTAPKVVLVLSNADCEGSAWKLTDGKGTTVLSGTVPTSLNGKGDYTPFAFNHAIDLSAVTTEGSYTLSIDQTEPVTVRIGTRPVADLIHGSLRFLRAQRSGSAECVDHAPGHFGDSLCYVHTRTGDENTSDWQENAAGRHVDMRGGWYDGYIYTKYTLTIGYTTYYLLRAYETQPGLFVKKLSRSGLVDILDEAKFGLDYLVRTMPDDSTFIIQVGGFADNEEGCRLPAEDTRDGKREAYSIMSTPQMANAVAALALGSVIFAGANQTADARRYADAARRIYAAAIKHESREAAWIEKDYELCKDESRYDNLALAAAEMHRLTGEAQYLEKAKAFATKAKNPSWVSYAEQHMTAHLRLGEAHPPSQKFLVADLNSFNQNAASANNIYRLPVEYTFAGLYNSMAAASAALTYQKTSGQKTYEQMATGVIDYLLGRNNWGMSFLASKAVPRSVRNFYSQIYLLQTALFPEGAIAVGPCDTQTHDSESKWCFFDPRTQPTYPFNTPRVRFYDHSDDYMCTDALISGAADGIYLLTRAVALYGK